MGITQCLFSQAQEVQEYKKGITFVGTVLLNLVGAKFDVVLGVGTIEHHGFSVADRSTNRNGDFQVDAAAIHGTTHPSEALVRKCAANLKSGRKLVIVTLGEGVAGAAFLL